MDHAGPGKVTRPQEAPLCGCSALLNGSSVCPQHKVLCSRLSEDNLVENGLSEQKCLDKAISKPLRRQCVRACARSLITVFLKRLNLQFS